MLIAALSRLSSRSVAASALSYAHNKADVSGNDLVEFWENDPETRVMCMYLESFGNPRRFTEIAKRVTRKKPILIVKSGRTAEGARLVTKGAFASVLDACDRVRRRENSRRVVGECG